MTARLAPILAVALSIAMPVAGRAHCDTLGGPVVASGRKALETGDPAHALVWVKVRDERELRAAFTKARQERAVGGETAAAGERRFIETLVRVHRRGEGAPYTGLKPAGEGVGEAVRVADDALQAGNAAPVADELAAAIRSGVARRFAPVSRPMPVDDVAAGRAWVAAYVEYVHYVEALEKLARSGEGDAHGAASPGGSSHAHAH